MNKKNSVPHTRLPGICSNTLGSVMNTSLGPSPGSTPKAKQAGKMISPVSRATVVSSTPILTASPVRLRALPIYEPKIAMALMPRLSVKNACPMAAYTASPKLAHFSAAVAPWNIFPKSGTR